MGKTAKMEMYINLSLLATQRQNIAHHVTPKEAYAAAMSLKLRISLT